MMNHPAEMAVHSYLSQVGAGQKGMSKETIGQISTAVAVSVDRQFNGRAGDDEFSLRMSNIGRPYCQLWYQKNKPEAALTTSTTHIMNMTIGDIVEAVFYGVLTEAGIKYTPQQKVEGMLGRHKIKGTMDMILDEKVDDIKSASGYAYTNKFTSSKAVAEEDPFGYVGQLISYSIGGGKPAGGWWVLNKNSGEFKYIPYAEDNAEEVKEGIAAKLDKLEDENTFERTFEPVEETFRKKPSGNTTLPFTCQWCDFRDDCWEGKVKELPSLVSQAKEKPIVPYIHIDPKYGVEE